MSRRVTHEHAAEHEAAHVVVGLALGLRLRKATVEPSVLNGERVGGYTWFSVGRRRLAFGVMVCAGIAWEGASEPHEPSFAAGDWDLAREYLKSESSILDGVRLAREVLNNRRRLHRQVTLWLLDQDLTEQNLLHFFAEYSV